MVNVLFFRFLMGQVRWPFANEMDFFGSFLDYGMAESKGEGGGGADSW